MTTPKKLVSLFTQVIFEGSYVEKSQCIFLLITLVGVSFSALLSSILLLVDYNSTAINRTSYEELLVVSSLFSAYCFAMYTLGKRLTDCEHLWYSHVCILSYVFINCLVLFFIGPFSMATGIALAGAPTIGLIIYNQRFVYSALGTGLTVLIGAIILFQYELLPYAPIRNENIPHYQDEIWLFTTSSFVFSHLALLVFIASVSINRWRAREAEVTYLSTTDVLTGIPNRRFLMEQFTLEYQRAIRNKQPISIFIVDLDFFKQVNDVYGHLSGDEALRSAARILKNSLREIDLVGRYGGEEFLAILPNTNLKSAYLVAERFRENLEKHKISVEHGKTLSVTASIGLNSHTPKNIDEIDHFLADSDKALYKAKNEGRNQVAQVDSSIRALTAM